MDSDLTPIIEATSTASEVRKVSGAPAVVPLVRLLWVIQCRRMTGLLSLEGARRARLHIRNGCLVDLGGAGRWSVGSDGATASSLSEAIGIRISQGIDVAEALEGASQSVCELLAPWILAESGTVSFDVEGSISSTGFPLPRSLVWMGWNAFLHAVDGDAIEALWSPKMRAGLRLKAPLDRFGMDGEFDALGARVLRLSARNPEVWRLVDLAGQGREDRRREVLARLEWFTRLGLVEVVAVAAGEEKTAPPIEQSGAADGSAVEPEVSAEEADVDPREVKLTEVLSELQTAPLLSRLELSESRRKPNREDLSQAFRSVSSRYHPDRYVNAPAVVRGLAERCFALINATAEELKSPDALAEAWREIECLKSGAVYVDPRRRTASQIALKKGELFVRNRRYADAIPLLEESVELDPTAWEAALLLAYCGYLSGSVPAPQAIEQLDALAPNTGPGVARLHLNAGRIWKLEGQERRSLQRFTKALEADPACHEAEREIRLARRRTAATEANSESKRWFSRRDGD